MWKVTCLNFHKKFGSYDGDEETELSLWTQYLLEPLMEMPENNHMDAMLLRHVIYLTYLIEVTMLLESTS